MTLPDPSVLDRFHRVLVEEIRSSRPDYLDGPFTVAEIYQHLVPYRTHRDAIGVEINGDYEDALLRLLAGEGDYLVLESEPALREIREELESSNPDTSLYRDFAAVDVRLNPDKVDVPPGAPSAPAPEVELDPPPAPEYHLDEPVPTWAAPTTPREEADPPVEPEGAGRPVEAPDTDGPVEPVEAGSDAAPHEASEPVEAGVRDEARRSDDDRDAGACRSCGGSLPPRDDLAFCPFCGTDQRLVVCDECGETLEPEWRYCIGCGHEAGS